MAVETSVKPKEEEHFPDRNAAKIQNAIAVLSGMESNLEELSQQVVDMQKKLLLYAEAEAEKAKALIIETANKEAQQALDSVRAQAQKEADAIVKKGQSETEALKKRVTGKIQAAVDLIVKAVQST